MRSGILALPAGAAQRFCAQLGGRPEVQKILANAGWLIAGRGVQWIAVFFVGIVVARYLGPHDLGVYKWCVALILLFGSLLQLGLTSTVAREIVAAPERTGEIMGTAFLLRVGAWLAGFPVVLAVADLLQGSSEPIILFAAILGVGNLFTACRVVDYWFEAHTESKHVVKARSIAFFLIGGSRLVLVWQDAPLIAFVMTAAAEWVLIGIGSLIAYALRGQNLTQWRFRCATAKSLLRRSWPLTIATFTSLVYLKIDQVMLGQMVSPEAVGIYAVAASLSETWFVIPTALAASVFPNLIRSRETSTADYDRRLQHVYDVLALGALAFASLIAIFATPVITLIYGEAFRAAGPILSIHIWQLVFMSMQPLTYRWLIIEDLQVFSLLTQGVGAALNVALNLILIPQYGGIGAAVATVVSYAAACYFALFLSARTRKAGRMMTLALLAPLRLVWAGRHFLRRSPSGSAVP